MSNIDDIALTLGVLHHAQVDLVPIAHSFEDLFVLYVAALVNNVDFVLYADGEELHAYQPEAVEVPCHVFLIAGVEVCRRVSIRVVCKQAYTDVLPVILKLYLLYHLIRVLIECPIAIVCKQGGHHPEDRPEWPESIDVFRYVCPAEKVHSS